MTKEFVGTLIKWYNVSGHSLIISRKFLLRGDPVLVSERSYVQAGLSLFD
jgi:hypothetical protein